MPLNCSIGVTDGARTRDIQYHKLALYQLNYGHRVVRQCATSPTKFHILFLPVRFWGIGECHSPKSGGVVVGGWPFTMDFVVG